MSKSYTVGVPVVFNDTVYLSISEAERDNNIPDNSLVSMLHNKCKTYFGKEIYYLDNFISIIDDYAEETYEHFL